MSYVYQAKLIGQDDSSGTITIPLKNKCWHNQLVVIQDTATAGTLTIKYRLAGKPFVLKDTTETPVTMSLTSQPDPVKFDGLVDEIIIEQSGVNGTFSVLLIGSSTS